MTAIGNSSGRLAWLTGLVTACVLLGSASLLRAATFTATLDRNTVELGSRAVLTLTFRGGQPSQVPVFEVPGLRIEQSGHETSLQFDGIRSASQTAYTYLVAPEQLGEFTIPEITVRVGSEQLRSAPLKLTAVRPGSAVAGANGEALAMLKLVLPRREAFVGEAFVAQLELYLHNSIQNVGGFQITALPTPGFTVGKSAEGQRRTVLVGNTAYALIPISIVLTPVKPGTSTIGPVSARMVVETPNPNRRRDFWGPLGMIGRADQREVVLGTDPETLEIKPLPSPQPPAFSGAIGQFQLGFSAAPTNVAVGDPITIKVRIQGRGVLEGISLPAQNAWSAFKAYPPTAKTETEDPLGIQGVRAFEQVVVPQSTEAAVLPQFSFSYFDPDAKEYQTLTHGAVPLVVRPAGSMPALNVGGNSRDENNAAGADILPIRQRPGRMLASPGPVLANPAFLALQSVPVIALVAALLWRKRTEALANNPRLRRQRQVAGLVRNGIQELRRHASENQSDVFFATVFRLLQEQIGERLDAPASSITEAVVDERLRPRGVSDSTLSQVHELFQLCNLARYAPVKTSQELSAIIPKVEATLAALQEVRG